jgi:hypothetical protein
MKESACLRTSNGSGTYALLLPYPQHSYQRSTSTNQARPTIDLHGMIEPAAEPARGERAHGSGDRRAFTSRTVVNAAI